MQVKGPSIELDVATLRNKEKTEAKAKDLLLREIQVTKRLIKNTRVNDTRRADFLLRLAEGYFELVQVAQSDVRKLDEPMHQSCTVKKDKTKCSALQKQQKDLEATLKDTREDKIKTLALLVKDHPEYKKMDEVLFALGFSLDEMKQFDRARQVYHRLIKGYPQSDYIPNAYLSFAEYYFQQGDMRAAQQFYQKVTEIPPARNKVYGYALYKQAWCHYNNEDFKASLQSFVETIEFGTKNPEAANVENLVRQSRKELVMPYAQIGSPERALDFFKRYAKDDDQAFGMFENLGELYFDTGKWPDVIAVYHSLDGRAFERRQGLLLADARHQRDRVVEAEAAAGHRDRADDRFVGSLRQGQPQGRGQEDLQAGSGLRADRPRDGLAP